MMNQYDYNRKCDIAVARYEVLQEIVTLAANTRLTLKEAIEFEINKVGNEIAMLRSMQHNYDL